MSGGPSNTVTRYGIGAPALQNYGSVPNFTQYYDVSTTPFGLYVFLNGVWNQVGSNLAATATIFAPQGRVTLTTGVPVLTSDALAQATTFYTPYNGALAPVFDGTTFSMQTFAELSQATTDATKSPAACANNSNYDLFLWADSSTIRCTRGPAWTSATARGAGAGTTELQMVSGLLTNKNAITNGPAANRGTYAGSIRTNGTATVDVIFGGAGVAGGESATMGIWNCYNRRQAKLTNFDNTNSWPYTTATWRAKNNSAANGITMIRGLDEDAVFALTDMWSLNATANITRAVAWGLDVTNAIAADSSTGISSQASNAWGYHAAAYSGFPGLGWRTLTPLEWGQATGASTWYGDNGDATTAKSQARATVAA